MTGQLAEEERLASSRQRVEQRLAAVRDGIHGDLGIVPRTASWVLPAIGLAFGFSFAVRAFRRRRGREGTRLAGVAGKERSLP